MPSPFDFVNTTPSAAAVFPQIRSTEAMLSRYIIDPQGIARVAPRTGTFTMWADPKLVVNGNNGIATVESSLANP